RALSILTDIVGGLNARLNHPLNLLRLFFDFPHAGYYTAGGITKKFVGPREHDKPHLLTEKIQRRRAHSGSGQPLLHSGKATFARAQGKKLYLLVWIEAKMLEYQPGRGLKSAAGGVESNCLTPKLLNGLIFRA